MQACVPMREESFFLLVMRKFNQEQTSTKRELWGERGQNAEKDLPSNQSVVITTWANITGQTCLDAIRAYISTVPLTCGRIGGTMGLISGGGPCSPP